MTEQTAPTVSTFPSLTAKLAARFGVEPNRMLATLKATAFRSKGDTPEPTNEQLMALLIVADQYGLNPWTKELYAYPDKQNGIVPVVGVDGWCRIVNEHPQLDGVDFVEGPPAGDGGLPEWIECVLHRKDRAHPTRVREYMSECKRGTGPWSSHPRRMLRHKAFMQCGRIGFGFVGIHDPDEAEQILDGIASRSAADPSLDALNKRIATTKATVIDGESIRVGTESPTVTKTGAPDLPTSADWFKRVAAAESSDALALLADLIEHYPPEDHNEMIDHVKQSAAALSVAA